MDQQAGQRRALDHALALVADAPWSAGLVLRGSMAMTAWVGNDAAREPADLDWIVPGAGAPVDSHDPYPFVELEAVQQWPEAAAGAARHEMWAEEEFATGGLRPITPPEGLHWMDETEWQPRPPYEDLIDRIRKSPYAGGDVFLEAEGARDDGIWFYEYTEAVGTRLSVPWHVIGSRGVRGTVQLDFARDEPLPQAPVWTRIPRRDGGFTVVRTATPELSLAWKLLWLRADARASGCCRGKDLYDAVLLAELPGMVLPAALVARVLGPDFTAEPLSGLTVSWTNFPGTADAWLGRLERALTIA